MKLYRTLNILTFLLALGIGGMVWVAARICLWPLQGWTGCATPEASEVLVAHMHTAQHSLHQTTLAVVAIAFTGLGFWGYQHLQAQVLAQVRAQVRAQTEAHLKETLPKQTEKALAAAVREEVPKTVQSYLIARLDEAHNTED